MVRLRCLAVCLLVLVATSSCPKPAARNPRSWFGASSSPPAPKASDTGLMLRLGEGSEKSTPARAPVASATPIGDAKVQQLLARVKPMEREADDEQDFAVRERSLPPPRAGKTIDSPFPPPQKPVAPPTAEAGALQVLRHMPEGDVPLAPHLSITFSQPMVAVTSHDDLATAAPPVILTPKPPGHFRWVGTKTVLFEPDGRFPMATAFRVEVPAGTRSVTGGTLTAAAHWTFQTPAPKLQSSFPHEGPAELTPVLFASFDQKVDPPAVLASIEVTANGKRQAVRMATTQEIAADPHVNGLAASAEPGRYVAFRVDGRLPPDAEVKVVLGPGTPSAEGPRRTETAQAFGFRTYGPMKVVDQNCKGENECSPYGDLTVETSNPIARKLFRADMVKVDPVLPGMKVTVSNQTLVVRGKLKARTTYKATISAELPDIFGQTLGSAQTVSFVTGKADAFVVPGPEFAVLDPSAGPHLSVFTMNHRDMRVRLFAVGPSDFDAFSSWKYEIYNRDVDPKDPPGHKVQDKRLSIANARDEMVETRIDLTPALHDGFGNVIAIVEDTRSVEHRRERQRFAKWVSVTHIGIDAFADADRLVCFATALADGSPLSNVEISLEPNGAKEDTSADGTATLAFKNDFRRLLVARKGSDLAILPEISRSAPQQESLLWYVADDRKMYRPGEQVKLKGWLRVLGPSIRGDLALPDKRVANVEWKLDDARGNELSKGTTAVNAFGGFDLSLTLPKTTNLGNARLVLDAKAGISGSQWNHQFQVQEFRRPEYEVTAHASEGPHFAGGSAEVTVDATYYAGGGLPGAEVTWQVTANPGHFTPPNRDEFSFGIAPSWSGFDLWARQESSTAAQSYSAHTDGAGKHRLRIEFLPGSSPRTMTVDAQASVQDVNRQAWTAAAGLVVHPASLYVGLKLARPFVEVGQEIHLDVIAVDLDGKAVTGKHVAVKSRRIESEWSQGEVEVKEVEPEECALVSAGSPGRCSFKPKEGGMHRITATVTDDRGRLNQTELSAWVAGGRLIPERNVQEQPVRLLADKKEYRAGETAEILVIAPFFPAQGVMTLQRRGLIKTERFAIDGPSYTLKVPIEEWYTPSATVQVDLVGATERTSRSGEPDKTLPKRPAFASGRIDLQVPPYQRTLAVKATPRDSALSPGANTEVAVDLRDPSGNPVVGGEVVLVVVDESVLALTGYRLPDPLPLFYASRPTSVQVHHQRASVLLATREDATDLAARSWVNTTASSGAMPGVFPLAPPAMEPLAAMTAPQPVPEGAQAPIRLRSDFRALASFSPSVVTDAKGHAIVPIKMPDSLTRYRVMAVAAAGDRRFGSGESTITVRLPLMVRPSAPRFMNFGDKIELPVVLQNQTDQRMDAEIAVRAANATLTAGAGRKVAVPPNDRVEVRFPASTVKAGTARFQIAAASGTWSDAAEVSLPVWTPATTEAFATYGTIDHGAIAQPFAYPNGVFPQFGGIEVTTSATAVQSLTDAVLYLVSYPYECSEQIASRVLAVASLRDVLGAFRAEGLPPPEQLEKSVGTDIERLRMLQGADGGFSFWRRGDEEWPYLSVHVTHALVRAQLKGYPVPDPMLSSAKRYLREIEAHFPNSYPAEVRNPILAYALYVRWLLRDPDPARARRLIEESGGLEKLGFEGVGWVYSTLSQDKDSSSQVEAIRKLLANRVEETAGAAHFTTAYSDGAHLLLHSDRRVDGILLEALIVDQPKSDLIAKLVEGLMAHRTAGHWSNTQENGLILVALDKYFNTYEKLTPDFVARVWLGKNYAGEHAFRGRTVDRQRVFVPMSFLAREKASDLVLAKEGPGRLYYRIGMSYAPTDLRPPPADHGFTVERTYEGIDDSKDVRKEKDGVWHVKAGSRVRVRLTMSAPAQRYHVALTDPLPAGLEPMNPALAVTGKIPANPKADSTTDGYWWLGPWYVHQNLRDERAEAFTTLLPAGVYTYDYVTRATTPGSFVVPPPKAEEMYHPETFGRGACDRVVVE